MSPTAIDFGRLSPAAQLADSNTVHFHNESAEYRAARNALLAKEIELRRYLERVAASGVRSLRAAKFLATTNSSARPVHFDSPASSGMKIR